MACTDCFNNCPENPSDKCVKYTGEDIPFLDICTGDPLSKLDAAIIESLETALDGSGIILSTVTLQNAPYLLPFLGVKNKTLGNLIQMLIDSQQNLKQLLDSLKVNPTSFDTQCLTGLPASPTKDQILAAALVQICALKTLTSTIDTTYVKLTDLPSLVTQLNNASTGSSIPAYKNRMVPGVVYPYQGSLSNFDNTGKGIVSLGFESVYICNGLNGTNDWRGRSPIGAMRNVPGATPDNTVNPSNPLNAVYDVNYAIKDKPGINAVKLTANQNGPHTHSIVDPGHTHNIPTSLDGTSNGKAVVGNTGTDGALITSGSQTNISLGNSGNGDPHLNVHPSFAILYIIYIPLIN